MSDRSAYKENCERALIQCARVCCVCRRFRPSHIQVHHVIERSAGGTDDFYNLIPVCIFCHQGHVHATVPFTQRFTANELKGLRDAVYALVAQGRLVPFDGDADTSLNPLDESAVVPEQQLSNEARALLLEAVKVTDGSILKVRDRGGLTVQANEKNMVTAPNDGRCEARWEGAVNELLENGLIADVGHKGQVFRLTRTGYKLAGSLRQRQLSGPQLRTLSGELEDLLRLTYCEPPQEGPEFDRERESEIQAQLEGLVPLIVEV